MPPEEESSTSTGPFLDLLNFPREVDRKTWVSVLWPMCCLGISSERLCSFLPWNFMNECYLSQPAVAGSVERHRIGSHFSTCSTRFACPN